MTRYYGTDKPLSTGPHPDPMDNARATVEPSDHHPNCERGAKCHPMCPAYDNGFDPEEHKVWQRERLQKKTPSDKAAAMRSLKWLREDINNEKDYSDEFDCIERALQQDDGDLVEALEMVRSNMYPKHIINQIIDETLAKHRSKVQG